MKRLKWLALIGSLALLLPTNAQVPDRFTNVYGQLHTWLTNFAATVDTGWDGTQSTCLMAAALMPATSGGRAWGSEDASTDTNFLNSTVVPYLNGLEAMGVKAVKFAIQFPILYQPYYEATNGANDPAGYTNTLTFYTNLVALLRQRGMKIIIPTQAIITSSNSSIFHFEESLSIDQFVAGRSALAQTIARYLQPDYLLLQSEPDTEASMLPPHLGALVSDPDWSTNMISVFLRDLQAKGLRSSNMVVGAGFGSWQDNFPQFLHKYVNIPGLDELAVHVYSINVLTNHGAVEDFLGRLLQMADAAHAKGLRIGIGECWLTKRGNDDPVTGNSQRGRNVYSFWAPLDREFLLCMVKVGHWKHLDYIAPYYSDCFFDYLDYEQMLSQVDQWQAHGLSEDQIGSKLEALQFQAVLPALAAQQETDCGRGYAEYIQGGLPSLRIMKTNAGLVHIGWSPVAVKFLLEEKSALRTAGSWSAMPIPQRGAGEDYSVFVATTNARGFYRLHGP
jgi:hypothetical protein